MNLFELDMLGSPVGGLVGGLTAAKGLSGTSTEQLAAWVLELERGSISESTPQDEAIISGNSKDRTAAT